MKPLFLLVYFFGIGISSGFCTDITTIKGDTYNNISVLSTDGERARVSHDSGVLFISFDDLAPSVQPLIFNVPAVLELRQQNQEKKNEVLILANEIAQKAIQDQAQKEVQVKAQEEGKQRSATIWTIVTVVLTIILCIILVLYVRAKGIGGLVILVGIAFVAFFLWGYNPFVSVPPLEHLGVSRVYNLERGNFRQIGIVVGVGICIVGTLIKISHRSNE